MSSQDELPQALRRFLIADRGEEDGDILDVAQAATRLDETSETIERWIEEKRLLAWRDVKGLRIPAEQIIGSHRIVPGIERVLELMPSARSAWDFLRFESPFFPSEPQRPLDALKTGQIDDVMGAIRAYGEAFQTSRTKCLWVPQRLIQGTNPRMTRIRPRAFWKRE
jgi:hypothetical protein